MFTKVFLFAVLFALGECQNRLIGAEVKEPVPFMVSIQHHHKHICAGVLIKPNLVLTAASCIVDYSQEFLEIRHDSIHHNSGGHIYYVKQIVCQGDYKPYGNENDYAALEIDTKLTTTAITLASSKVTTDLDAYGWGAVNSSNIISNKLRHGTFKEKDHEECKIELGTFVIGKTTMCTNSATCFGDTGGPLLSGTILQGIVSSNRQCLGQSSVFTDITKIRSIIEQCKKLVK